MATFAPTAMFQATLSVLEHLPDRFGPYRVP